MNSPCVNCGADVKACKKCDWYNGVWMPKDQYEARLKADMVDMLTDLKKEIKEQWKIPNNRASVYDWNNGVYACYKVIQQKIDALREVEDESDDTKSM